MLKNFWASTTLQLHERFYVPFVILSRTYESFYIIITTRLPAPFTMLKNKVSNYISFSQTYFHFKNSAVITTPFVIVKNFWASSCPICDTLSRTYGKLLHHNYNTTSCFIYNAEKQSFQLHFLLPNLIPLQELCSYKNPICDRKKL